MVELGWNFPSLCDANSSHICKHQYNCHEFQCEAYVEIPLTSWRLFREFPDEDGESVEVTLFDGVYTSKYIFGDSMLEKSAVSEIESLVLLWCAWREYVLEQ